jgi:tryptophanyl-tRNA synthetase
MEVAVKIHNMSTNGQRIQQTDPGDPDLCPVGDLHKVFSPEEMIAETQAGCRTAKIRCEFCKIDAARSVCKITEPIFHKRLEYESRIDETWEMLIAQAEKATRRAEETMLQVRTALNVTRDLGSLKRHYGVTEESRRKLYDLSLHSSDWWNLPSDQCTKLLREYWRDNLVPYDIPLRQEANRVFASLDRELEEPFLTAKKKRVMVAAASQDPSGWHFRIPAKSYEIWTLLCWHGGDYRLYDFVIPQSVYSQFFAQAKKALKKNESIHLKVSEDSGQWGLHFVDLSNASDAGKAIVTQADDPIDITRFLRNYEPLK